MSKQQRTYIAIDLKSFYASVECMERKRNPLTTNLVVADRSRTEKTICLAVSPSLKAYGIPGRARLFEVIERVDEINRQRLADAARLHYIRRNAAGRYVFPGSSDDAEVLSGDPALKLDYITALPRMQTYIDYSARIYDIYLKYIAPADIHVYSIDEVLIDATQYLTLYHMSAHELAMTIIRDIFDRTGITATCGIGTNLYLAKVAMDIVAKHMPADEKGVRIAELDEMRYRQLLWSHTPLTDFWRVGHGYAKKLQEHGLFTMGDIARCSIGKGTDYYNEDLLYQLFGINAELLIDHAWGWEPVTMDLIKAYKPEVNSISSGQVLQCPYTAEKGRLIVREMTDLLVLDLVEKGLVTDQIVLTVGYDIDNLKDNHTYSGPIVTDHYGRKKPKHAHGSIDLGRNSSSSRLILDKATELYDRIINPDLLIRRVNITANHVISEAEAIQTHTFKQLDLFTDYMQSEAECQTEAEAFAQERRLQQAMLNIKKRYGKNAILRGMNLEEGAMTIQRNHQIGGHRA